MDDSGYRALVSVITHAVPFVAGVACGTFLELFGDYIFSEERQEQAISTSPGIHTILYGIAEVSTGYALSDSISPALCIYPGYMVGYRFGRYLDDRFHISKSRRSNRHLAESMKAVTKQMHELEDELDLPDEWRSRRNKYKEE